MYIENLVFGLLDTSGEIPDSRDASRLRSITISWSRFGYQDLIIEADSINAILDRSLDLGYKYCLVQACGHVIAEDWYLKHWNHPDFQSSLREWIETTDFFVTGHIIEQGDGWFGLDQKCLLVNLKYYEQFGRPAFDYPSDSALHLPKPLCRVKEDPGGSCIERLEPSNGAEICRPGASGWNFINISLKNRMAVYNFNREIAASEFCITSEHLTRAEASPVEAPEHLSDGRNEILIRNITRTLTNAQRGVFICNIESYADIEETPPEFKPPLSRLYCVAAGFKPNRILHTHGFDEDTRILFFDYSPNALNVRKLLDQEWDGEDYPRFVRYVFKKFPYPETFYHLWANLAPDELNWSDVERIWQDEINKWGGQEVIKNHWAEYKELKRDYVQSNILTEQHKILERIENSANSVIWWSNAFFTVYSNWLYTIDEKKGFYDSWIAGLAARNPDIFLYGSDYNNTSVNCTQAGEYWSFYREHGADFLNPHRLYRHEMRF